MGLAIGQLGELTGISRKHDISLQLQRLSSDKLALARDMQSITKAYQTALSAKKFKWSNNCGVSYTDISYSTLMRPNSYNAKSPILISDSHGQIVLDKKYKKYAEQLDAAGGKWEGAIKNQILAELTGISLADIDKADAANEAADDAADKYEDLLDDLDRWKAKEPSSFGNVYVTADKLAKNLGSVGGKDLAALYKKGENSDYPISSVSDIKALAEGIKNNMSKYFVDDEKYLGSTDKSDFEAGCDAFVTYYTALINDNSSNADKNREADGLKGSNGDWTLDISKAFSLILGFLTSKTNSNGEKTYPLRDTSSSAWKNWYDGLVSRKDALDAAKEEYNSAMDSANQVMTADQETQLKYYDLLFQSIADNGWVYDTQIESSEYLNQMFQNNSYYITTIYENSCYDPDEPTSDRNFQFEYDTNIASNFEKIYLVNDSESRDDALVEYEYQKGIINEKEARIDRKMEKLKTEQQAITKMIESDNKSKNDNLERTMNLWG